MPKRCRPHNWLLEQDEITERRSTGWTALWTRPVKRCDKCGKILFDSTRDVTVKILANDSPLGAQVGKVISFDYWVTI